MGRGRGGPSFVRVQYNYCVIAYNNAGSDAHLGGGRLGEKLSRHKVQCMCVCTVPTCNEYLNVHACVRVCVRVCVCAGSKCHIQHSSFGLGVVTPSLHLLYIVMCVCFYCVILCV